MDPLALGAALAIMGAIVFGLIGIYQKTAHPRGNMERRLGVMLGTTQSYEASIADFEALRPTKIGKTPFISSLLKGTAWSSRIAEDLERADIKLTVSEYIALRIMLVALAAALPLLILGSGLVGLGAMAGAGLVSFFVPKVYVGYAAKKRVKKLEDQLVEALSLISNSLKAGFGLLQSFELASRQLEHPIATEIRRTLYDINVGSSTEASLMAMAQRSGSRDFDIIITAMLVQQSTGGNLSEILDNVAHTMRERIRIRGEIATLTAQQMLTGFIIGALPIFLGVIISAMNPDYIRPLFDTVMGNVMLGGAGMMELFGVLLIKKILAIEV